MSLVISRKSGQELVVGTTRILLTGFSGRCKCVIDAPNEVPIIRGELCQRQQQPENAAKKSPSPRLAGPNETPIRRSA